MRPFIFSSHAEKRLEEMGLTREEVLAVLDRPEIDRPSIDRRVSSRGELSIVYNPVERAIVTILWRYANKDYVRPKERFRWKDKPDAIVRQLLLTWTATLDSTTATAVGMQALSHFGLVCSPLPVHVTSAEVSDDRFVIQVDDTLIDLTVPLAVTLPSRFWLGGIVESGSVAYQYADLLWDPNWKSIPPKFVENLTEQMHRNLKEAP